LFVLKVNKNGELDLNVKEIKNADVIMATAAHNESGIIIDWQKIIDQAPSDAILMADAAQTVARVEPLPKRVDIIVCSAHKMGAFAGAGAVLLRNNGKKLAAPWMGGGQEGGLRPGSEAVAIIAAMGACANNIDSTRKKHKELLVIRNKIEKKLLKAWPSAQIIGQNSPRLANTFAITLNNVDGEALRIATHSNGLCVGFGSACSAMAPEPSTALLALGLNTKQARSTLRISLPPAISDSDVDFAINKLIEVVSGLSGV
ncbi:aminotransferase class V-fold PLP-dependent enzyme, partial [Sulfobacillus acidophilus]|nr:aminotransferase class V-fold PLP-dependent enzyme [Sulfobacillus acidophilus]